MIDPHRQVERIEALEKEVVRLRSWIQFLLRKNYHGGIKEAKACESGEIAPEFIGPEPTWFSDVDKELQRRRAAADLPMQQDCQLP